MNTYEEYLNHPAGDILTMEDALKIYTAMTESIDKCTIEDKMDFWNEFIEKAAKYTQIRCAWETMSVADKMEMDPSRTAAHNSLIDSINILSRIAATQGQDDFWRKELGDARKRIGDFACFVSYITGISNR